MDKKMLLGFSENAQDIVQTIHEPIIVLDSEMRLIWANRAFYGFFRVSSEDCEGRFLYDLGNKQWDIPKLRELLEQILPENKIVEQYAVEHNFETIGRKIMLLNARQIYTMDHASKLILLAISDVTDRIEAERQKDKLFADLQKAFNEIKTLRGILPICASCKKIRDDKGYWKQVEEYVSDHTEAEFSHGFCPSCAKRLYPEIFDDNG
jgi:PAS domain S-box-containing protein